MDQDPGPPEIRSPPRTRGWAGRQRNGQGAGEEARSESPDREEEEQPMDYQQAAVPEERADRDEEQDRARPNTHSQARAGQRGQLSCRPQRAAKSESACTRLQDGTIDMEPANLDRMCTILTSRALPYHQNKKAARYHVYATKDIKLPAKSAVEVDLGYRIQPKPGLMIHTFASAGLKGHQISAKGILTAGPNSTDSQVQLINLAAYDQGISKGTTL
ncbi:MAG: hypothetical protein GY696_14060 [Gammaproteobacteria bacterium]|nr:hypothetical protein [Gammaproteobacteria bacterium]